MEIDLIAGPQIKLERFGAHHASALFRIVDRDRAYLRQWLSWVDGMQSEQDFSFFATAASKRHQNGTEQSFAVVYGGHPLGRIGLYGIDTYNRIASVGYWLSRDAGGRGIMTSACRELVRFGFSDLDLNRIEIKCGNGNVKSAAIPERLQFVKEGVIRQGEFLNGQFIDLNLYAQLFAEWRTINRTAR